MTACICTDSLGFGSAVHMRVSLQSPVGYPLPLRFRVSFFVDLKKKKKEGVLRSREGCCWGARWLCWSFLCFALVVWLDIMPKVACHGDDVGDDFWLKWHSTFLTVLRHSWICRRHRIGLIILVHGP